MSGLVVPSHGIVKPDLWPVEWGLVAPEWRWVWDLDLAHAVIYRDVAAPYDMVQRTVGSKGATSLSHVVDELGPAPRAATSTTSEWLGVPYPHSGLTSVTVVAVLSFLNDPSSDNYGILSTAYSNSDGYRLRQQSTSTMRFRLIGSSGSLNVDVTHRPDAGGIQVLVARYDSSLGAGFRVYDFGKDALSETNSGSTVGTLGSDASSLRIGHDTNSSSASDVLYHAVYEFHRYLDYATLERLILGGDYFAPFRRARRVSVVVSGPTIHAGTCSMTGSGTLTAAAGMVKPGVVSMTGSGVLTATAGMMKPGVVSMTATGVVSIAETMLKPGVVSMSASGTLTAAAGMVKPAVVSMTGTGIVTASAGMVKPGLVSITASATLTSEASVVGLHSGTCSMTASATITVASAMIKPGLASLIATGTVTVASTAIRPATVSMTATGVLTSTASVIPAATFELAIFGNFSLSFPELSSATVSFPKLSGGSLSFPELSSATVEF